MLEIPNCSIKSSKLTSHDGKNGPYLKGSLTLEGDLTQKAADLLGCDGALSDNLPAFTIPRKRLKQGGDKKNPHYFELSKDGASVLHIPSCSVHAMNGSVSDGVPKITINVHVEEPLTEAVTEFTATHTGFVGTAVMAAKADPEDAQMSIDEAAKEVAETVEHAGAAA